MQNMKLLVSKPALSLFCYLYILMSFVKNAYNIFIGKCTKYFM